MKPWQNGFDLDYLKSVEEKYKAYNKYAFSKFAQVKKNTVADLLSKVTLIILSEDTFIDIANVKVGSNITMYGDTIIGNKKRGDSVITKLTGDTKLLQEAINQIQTDSWLYVWAENSEHKKLAEDCNFCYVGSKITTYSEIYSIYYRGSYRDFPVVDPAENVSVKKLQSREDLLSVANKISDRLKELPDFSNHFSSYNKKDTWSALSLRGFRPEPEFIGKPLKNEKFKSGYSDFSLQDTELMKLFPEVSVLTSELNCERIRFMRLEPGNGELTRHTDQVDPEMGGTKGKLSRLHFPIITNDDVVFTVWEPSGNKLEVNMKPGECWFLDTRKPHRVINGGNTPRIHLVIDCITDDNLHTRIIK